MGCSTSSQTSAVDPSRPTAKAEESNGASATGAANENGNIAEDSETIPDQTPAQGADTSEGSQPAGEAVVSAEAASAAVPPVGGEEESQQAAAAAASESTTAGQNPEEKPGPAETSAGAETVGPADPEESSGEPAAAAAADGQEKAEAASADPQTNTDETPAPSD